MRGAIAYTAPSARSAHRNRKVSTWHRRRDASPATTAFFARRASAPWISANRVRPSGRLSEARWWHLHRRAWSSHSPSCRRSPGSRDRGSRPSAPPERAPGRDALDARRRQRFAEERAQPGNTLTDLFGRNGAEGQPQRGAATGAELLAADVGHAALGRLRQELRGVDLLGQVDPVEVATLGRRPAGARGEVLTQRRLHRVAPLL